MIALDFSGCSKNSIISEMEEKNEKNVLFFHIRYASPYNPE